MNVQEQETTVPAAQGVSWSWRRGLLTAVIAGLAVGMLTSPAQSLFVDSFRSAANSAGPWCLVAFGVARRVRSTAVGGLTAAVTLAMCEIGYVVATEVRGGSNAPSTVVFWLTAAAIAGLPLGVAAVWSRNVRTLRGGAGFGVISGVLVGEGLYGLMRIRETTDWRYWVGELVVGLGVVCAIGVRTRSITALASCAGVAVVVAAVVCSTAIAA